MQTKIQTLKSKIRNEGRVFGQEIEYVPQIGSTNDRARQRARDGVPEGWLVLADAQQEGRGRRGRVWVTPPGGAILASLLLRPRRPADEAFAPIMILGLAVQVAVRAWGAPAVLKWPNDVLCGGRKLAGILCEMTLTGSVPDFVIAGFGVNVDFDPAAVGLESVATSLRQTRAAPPPDRLALLDRILAEAEVRYGAWQRGGYTAIWEEWRAALATLGTWVRIDPGDGTLVEGHAVRVERDGALVVATGAGDRRVLAGTILL